MDSQNKYAKPVFLLLAVILFFYGIIQAKTFLYPLAFGLLIAYLLFPFVNFLEKNRVPRILSILAGILSAVVVVGGLFIFFYYQLTHMLEDFGNLKERANVNIESLQENLESWLGLSNNWIEVFLKDQINFFFSSKNGGFSQVFTATTGTIVKIALLPVYIFLFLYYRTKFAIFILKIINHKHRRVAIKILRDISTVASRYILGVTTVVLILCVINSFGLFIVGVKYAILLGIVSALFNFIPYFGTLMGGAVPFLFVLITGENPLDQALKVALLFIIIQFIENNILTPNIVGYNVKISPFFIIIGLVLGAMVWGIPGMLLIVPSLAILRVVFSNIEKLQPYAFLLGPGGTHKHSITRGKILAFFNMKSKSD